MWARAALASVLLTTSALAAEPLAFTPSTDENYGETLTFIGDFNGQSYVQVQLSITNLGPGDGHGVCRFLVANAGAKPWSLHERYGPKEWGYAAADQRLAIGPCSAAVAGNKTVVRAALPAGSVELAFDAPPRIQPPPNNVITIDGAKHVSNILFFATPVTATIAAPGKASYTLRGMGYADHSRSEVRATKIAKQWIRFRALTASPPLLLLGRQTPVGTFGPFWMWSKDQAPQTLESFTPQRGGEKQRPTFELTLAGAQGPAGTLRSQTLLYRYAPIEELGFLGRAVKPLVGSPVTYTYRAQLQRPGAAPVDGILEVSLDQE